MAKKTRVETVVKRSNRAQKDYGRSSLACVNA